MPRSGLKYKLSGLHSSPSRRGKCTPHVASGTNTPPVQSPEWGEGKLGEPFYYGVLQHLISPSSPQPTDIIVMAAVWQVRGLSSTKEGLGSKRPRI